ncbi:zinc-binding dehydrogenase [Nocardioides sp. AE5]|uniref:zinc-binding dehydrogenase n=1 Tax=Nocardioides sp. AE5 TaxID=2962573 RepID=UPI0028823319|nr:zinc-binding dehydrogenase [Nocardioides sp. AE5]MDT0203535.1 zinc-binding dehydrogenase [Nocardioides sp. AE5]
MHAATIHAAGDIRWSDVPDPTIDAAHQAIVKVVAGCICGSDLWPYRGENPIVAGNTIGHECVGVVEEVGAEVRSFRAGDLVIVPFCHSDNTCPHCRYGVTSACVNLGFTTSGQGEHALVQQAEGSLVRVEADPDPALLPSLLALSDVMPTGWHAAVAAGVRPGGTAVVVGDGAVGLCAVLAASRMGAERVIVMSRHASRQAIARDFGATDVVAERGKEGAARILDLTDGVGADAVLECVGTDQAMKTALKVCRPGGGVGFVGVPHGVELPVSKMFQRNIGLRGGMAPVRAYIPDLLASVVAGEINPGRVFDRVLPMSEVAEGYRAMDERRAVKVMLQP